MNTILPVFFAVYPVAFWGFGFSWLMGASSRRRTDWLVDALMSANVVLFAFLAGPWAFTSYYLRYFLLGVFTFAVPYSYRRRRRGEPGARHGIARLALSVSLLVLLSMLNGLLMSSNYRTEESIELDFPLQSGSFCVIQGGNSLVTNPFHYLRGSGLALDIVQLNNLGSRASGISPDALHAYQIFGKNVLSPCQGQVVSIENQLPDNRPGSVDAARPKGNHVVLSCDGAEVVLAHLMWGSIEVAVGDEVDSGQLLGRVGNSGNTLEPHLHVAASREGRPLGLRFKGRLLSMNSVVEMQ